MVWESHTLREKASIIYFLKCAMLFCSSQAPTSNDLELILECKDSKPGGSEWIPHSNHPNNLSQEKPGGSLANY